MRLLIFLITLVSFAHAQTPPIEPGISHELAKWRAARYSDVRYKLDLTLEKMSSVLKGTMEIRLNVQRDAAIVLDWRKIRGHEEKSTISNVSINGRVLSPAFTRPASVISSAASDEGRPPEGGTLNAYEESNEHLILRDGVVAGENVIKLDFTSPILTSGSAITRYVDKEDGAEYIYSLFVPSDASTAFPVFDQPDLKARFDLSVIAPAEWEVVSNALAIGSPLRLDVGNLPLCPIRGCPPGFVPPEPRNQYGFRTTNPISTYVFAFTAGPWQRISEGGVERLQRQSEPRAVATGSPAGTETIRGNPVATAQGSDLSTHVFVRKSQLAKFQPHAAEVFRLNREGIKFLETYFDYKFPFPKYDLVLIPEFPFGGMEHAGATFLRESAVIFPQEPTKNDYISRANVIFHEGAHQWFGDTVTMKWFDDLWLKEGFAEFMAYKTLEKVMPEYNAWKVFYERNKQAAYLTDSTKGTTPIYQEIKNLSAAKSAYGNIVYRKAPSFLKQAEFYIGPDKFQTAVRGFLKKHEFANAGWQDLVSEFGSVTVKDLSSWSNDWVTKRGMSIYSLSSPAAHKTSIKLTRAQKLRLGIDPATRQPLEHDIEIRQRNILGEEATWTVKQNTLIRYKNGESDVNVAEIPRGTAGITIFSRENERPVFVFPNYQDYGYGIFLLDDKSRDYVLKNIHNEKDDFLRSMMWGSLWDGVREGELDPKEYVDLVIKVLSPPVRSPAFRRPASIAPNAARNEGRPPEGGTPNGEEDESTIATLLGRVSTAMTYYLSDAQRNAIAPKLEATLIEKMRTAPTLGQRITFYRAFLNVASTNAARSTLKDILNLKLQISDLKLKTKDRFDIVTRLLILNDPDAPRLLDALEKTETSDEAKRYAYAAKAGTATAQNKAKFWEDFTTNKDISESWIEAAFAPFNSVRHAELTLPYLERALKELPNHKRNRKIFFVNGWLGAFISGQKSEQALTIVSKFLADNPDLDRDLRLKILENVDLIERAVKIRKKFSAS